jgi:hypothetical protein
VSALVDDKEAVRVTLRRGGVEVPPSGSPDLRDPWGNNVQVVDYREIQFTKTPAVLQGMGLGELSKSEPASALPGLCAGPRRHLPPTSTAQL